ncbi:MAG: dihydroorotase [Turicibacter sp.]|nr:dihydroorotase [Turicibacter sp.]
MLLLKKAQILSQAGGLKPCDILIKDGKVAEMGQIPATAEHQVVELDGKLVAPGFIDVHVHLREPGMEKKETIESGTAAAARGGYTTIAAMPNTNPVPDSVENMAHVEKLIAEKAKVRVLPYASITVNEAGKEIIDMESVANTSMFAFTDDGKGIQEAGMMYLAMERAAKLGKPVVAHCEDDSLLFDGYLHAGDYAKANGHRGILSASESVHIARDIMLAQATGVHYHVCHISTKESVALVRLGKQLGINVTAEVSPHHLILADTDIEGDDTNFKMNPPLRSPEDVQACIDGLLDGTIDMIATDHAPHTAEEKGRDMYEAPFGIVGLETAFPLMYTHFVKTGLLTLKDLLEAMSTKPAEVFSLPYGKLEKGAIADLVVIDLEKTDKIDADTFLSKGKNTPFNGWDVTGWPVMTIFEGEIVHQ